MIHWCYMFWLNLIYSKGVRFFSIHILNMMTNSIISIREFCGLCHQEKSISFMPFSNWVCNNCHFVWHGTHEKLKLSLNDLVGFYAQKKYAFVNKLLWWTVCLYTQWSGRFVWTTCDHEQIGTYGLWTNSSNGRVNMRQFDVCTNKTTTNWLWHIWIVENWLA